LQFSSDELTRKIIHQCIQNGLITDWFLFAGNRMRIAPPLIITEEQLREMCAVILKSIDEAERLMPNPRTASV
jgi:4-aminobutyrate aminotransferase-like enzyme